MTERRVSAVLFAKELQRIALFYREVVGATVTNNGTNHEVLDCSGFNLVVHQIPAAIASSISISTPPERRERTAFRLDFPVPDIHLARQAAKRLGGHIDDQPPPWATAADHFFLGYDPEGNVIGLKLADNSPKPTAEE